MFYFYGNERKSKVFFLFLKLFIIQKNLERTFSANNNSQTSFVTLKINNLWLIKKINIYNSKNNKL